ncbi:MAG: hypothetical protein A2144_11575 [Chloroflexi bacterium RBG_16_50_9]|nr:MAG: hypothetical protein A2144_11575 [Chloroflexi bacterium RBG_16_50_9]
MNKTTSEAYGVIMVSASDPGEAFTLTQEENDEEVVKEFAGETLEAFPFFVEVSAESTGTIEKRIMFEGITLELFAAQMHQFEANTASEFPCPFHGKTARVSLPQWLRLR